MDNVVGKPVQGENFFGRERELEDLKRATADEHILLLAPRRVGKTSLLFALQDACARDRSATAVYASVAAARSERQFVELILEAVYGTPEGKRLRPNRVFGWFRRQGRRVKNLQVAGQGVELAPPDATWQEDADRALRPLLGSRRPWLLLIDELPALVLDLARSDESGARVRTFLEWFRTFRQHPAGAGSLRFVLAGSIGLDSVTRRYCLSDTINDLRDWRLGPYSAATADRFLTSLGASYDLPLSAGLRERVCAEAEWLIPYHLQVIFSALRESLDGAVPSEAALDATIAQLLTRRNYFNYWDERLRAALGVPEDAYARAILGACAADPRGATSATLKRALAAVCADAGERERALTWVLDVLTNDGYLVENNRRWRFRSGLLRRYWNKHFA